MAAEHPFAALLNGAGGRMALVAAHPDDEVVGAGGQFARLGEPTFISLTDGAPRDMGDARAAGFSRPEDYARARRDELRAALALAGVKPDGIRRLGRTDQEAALDLAGLSGELAVFFFDLRTDLVLTHAYEGGHPDHDAAAFAVHAAARLLERRGFPRPVLIEFTGYFSREGRMEVLDFLPQPEAEKAVAVVLSPEELAIKKEMVARFRTQQQVLRVFPLEVEKFRPAPAYDFTRPPHAGRLFYEHFPWGMDGPRWRRLARRALGELGLGGRR